MRDPIDVLLQVVKWLDENYQDKETLSMPNPDSVNIAILQLEKDYAELMERNDKNLMAIDMLTRFIEKSEIETEKLRDMLKVILPILHGNEYDGYAEDVEKLLKEGE